MVRYPFTHIPVPGGDTEDGPRRMHAPSIQAVHACLLVVAVALSVVALFSAIRVLSLNNDNESVHARYESCTDAIDKFSDASDYLTSQTRMFVVTHDEQYLDHYVTEIEQTKTRDAAISSISAVAQGSADPAYSRAADELSQAYEQSENLAEREQYAMRLVAESAGMDAKTLPGELAKVNLTDEHKALSAKDKQALAETMTLESEYQQTKADIQEHVAACTQALVEGLQDAELVNREALSFQIMVLAVVVVLLVCMIGVATLANYLLVVRPVRAHVRSIDQNAELVPSGANELRALALSYNHLYYENYLRAQELRHEAETDSLTGLLNRGAYDKLMDDVSTDTALVLIDVDMFKKINDTYGHEVGDRVLKKVSDAIVRQFRTSDHTCRVGGDEFAVIMPHVGAAAASREVISDRLQHLADALRDTSDGLPATTLSMGVAVCTPTVTKEHLYRAADQSLYQAKHLGRNQFSFYESGAQA